MRTFLEEVLADVNQHFTALDKLIFVLPSKRAGTFLKNSIVTQTQQTAFLPTIYSIEDFVAHVSGISYASATEQLFSLYNAYCNVTETPESFQSFTQWGQTMLSDFNEIDRYLIDSAKIFNYLGDIQELSQWYVSSDKTPMVESYVAFWKNLEPLYHEFNSLLLHKKLGHQGLVYRKANEGIKPYIQQTNQQHIFIGFNALNTAESNIIQQLLEAEKGHVYWDNERNYIADYIHDAGLFMRQHLKEWPYLKKAGLKGVQNYTDRTKTITTVGVPKNVSQAKYVGSLLKELQENSSKELANIAVVLGDETLLNPVLNAVPNTIDRVNITMGYPLKSTPLASFFNQLFELYLQEKPQGWSHQQVLGILTQPYAQRLIDVDEKHNTAQLRNTIMQRNWTYITLDKLEPYSKQMPSLAFLFFSSPTPLQFITNIQSLIPALKTVLMAQNDSLGLEYLFHFNTLFNQIKELLIKHHFINSLKALHELFTELIQVETLDFQGEPLEGVQIMGMLESRNLDFETIIITGVNEGILPAGKSNNSFIPFDVKKYFGLPTFKEKDAVYTYHFYRLLQRAKKVYLVYNTAPDVLLGGEKSRLITQLETATPPNTTIHSYSGSAAIQSEPKTPTTIEKTPQLLARLKAIATQGFSPSSLSAYIRNPMGFYQQRVLGINDTLAVEDTIAHNTFGTIVHECLETLYTPFIGKQLTAENIKSMLPKIAHEVEKQFKLNYADGDFSQGKNLIAYHVIIRYITNYLQQEQATVTKHQIKIIGLEKKMEVTLHIPTLPFPVKLKGTIDRIDECDGQLRIIDYKTGKVALGNVQIAEWETLITEEKQSKAFQLLCYALMYENTNPNQTITAGIFSFKNASAGLLQFGIKASPRARTAENTINKNVLELFKNELDKLITEICSAETPFIEKEV